MYQGGDNMNIPALLHQANHAGDLRDLDLHTGLFLMQRCGQDELVLLAGALASASTSMGNTCLPLDALPELFPWLADRVIPEPAHLREHLLATPAVTEPGGCTPLVLDGQNRLYLFRYHAAEQRIAEDLKNRASTRLRPDLELAAQQLALLFPGASTNPDPQRTAVALAQLSGLTVLSGGPGTGKTWTAARILALAQAIEQTPLRMAMAAPTGKAAARLDESIRASALDPELPSLLSEAKTLHRLLGFQPEEQAFRYNRDHPLDLDLLLVDEASMIDLVLMDNILAALPPACRLILLGDHHQLASVEAGTLFGDLCQDAGNMFSPERARELASITGTDIPRTDGPNSTIADAVVRLEKSHRFTAASGIGQLATAINPHPTCRDNKGDESRRQQAGAVPGFHINNNDHKGLTTCLDGQYADLHFHDPGMGAGEEWLRQQIINGYEPLLTARTMDEAFAALASFRILCALRRGRFGVAGANELCRTTLIRAGLLDNRTGPVQGAPIIIRQNHYHLGLFNGDTGIFWPDKQGRMMAWFMAQDNHPFAIAPARLPAHDPAWSITVHKAQGSEFDRVLLVLPEAESRILSRELLYTAVTRAKKELALFGSRETVTRAMAQPIRRYSGLADLLS